MAAIDYAGPSHTPRSNQNDAKFAPHAVHVKVYVSVPCASWQPSQLRPTTCHRSIRLRQTS